MCKGLRIKDSKYLRPLTPQWRYRIGKSFEPQWVWSIFNSLCEIKKSDSNFASSELLNIQKAGYNPRPRVIARLSRLNNKTNKVSKAANEIQNFKITHSKT